MIQWSSTWVSSNRRGCGFLIEKMTDISFFCFNLFHCLAKAVAGLDRESAHPLQLNTRKWSCCTAANPGCSENVWWWWSWSLDFPIESVHSKMSLCGSRKWVGWFPIQSSDGLFPELCQTKNWILSVWQSVSICGSSVVHYFNGTELHCALIWKWPLDYCVEPSQTGGIYYSHSQTLLTVRPVH